MDYYDITEEVEHLAVRLYVYLVREAAASKRVARPLMVDGALDHLAVEAIAAARTFYERLYQRPGPVGDDDIDG